MNRVLVVGGGFSGLTASVYLSENNYEVTLLEASPKLGGRAYSLFSKVNSDYYDNGQHILMGCYEETLTLMKMIGAEDKLITQKSLIIPFVKKGGEIFKLETTDKFYPFNLLLGFMKFKALTLKDRFKIIDFFLDLICCESCDLNNKTVEEWLSCKNQSANSIKSFWEVLVVGALNTTIEKASAEIFSEILKRIFFTGNNSATVLIPKNDLSNFYVTDAEKFITSKNGKILLSEKIEKLKLEGNKIAKVVTDKGTYQNFDYIILAIPAYSVKKIIDDSKLAYDIPEFSYSPIINAHFWLKENPFSEKFYGLIDSKVHWLFNQNKHITCTTSAANELMTLDNSEIKRLFCSEIELYFPIFNSELVTDSIIIKEKRATFIPDIESTFKRKNVSCEVENLFFAGDWTDTGLPSTIESAVASGKKAFDNVVNNL